MALINNGPLVTIAIPTYNRADHLDLTLKSIVNQDVFKDTNLVEIVISDNCSTDNTAEIVKNYTDLYGPKILYYKNKENVLDRNFELALSRGNGQYLKLNNDTLLHKDNALKTIIDLVTANLQTKNVLFFLNQSINDSKSLLCNDINDFVAYASYYTTWIAAFGIWKEDFDSIKDFGRYSHLQLIQTDVLFRIISNNRSAFINNDSVFVTQEVSKGGYDILTVFLDNYTFILREYVHLGYLDRKIYDIEIRKILIKFICKVLAVSKVFPQKFMFKEKSQFVRIVKFYKNKPLLLLTFFVKLTLVIILQYCKKIFTNVKVTLRSNKALYPEIV